MGDIGSAFSSGLSDLTGSASSALSGMGSMFSGLMGGGSSGGGSSAAGGGGGTSPQPQPTPAQTQPAVSPQASQAMSVNPPTLPTNDQSGTQQNQNQGRSVPPVPMVPPSTIADIIKGLGLAAPDAINPWLATIAAGGTATATPADTGELKPGQPGFIPPSTAGGSTTNMDAQSTPYGPASATPAPALGGGPGNEEEAPTNLTAAGEPRVDPNSPPIPPPRPASAAPSSSDGAAGGAAAPAAGGGGGAAANVPAVAATPESGTAPAAGAGGGQPDMGQLFQQIIMPLLGAAMGGGAGGPMGGLLGMAMQALGGGMGGNMPSPFAGPMAGMWGRRGFGGGRFGRGGFMIPGRGFGGQGRGGMWPYWHPNFGWRMHNAHPGGMWQPHPGGQGGGMAGRNWAANRYGGGIPGAGGPGAGGARQTPDGSPPNGARAGAEATKGGGATSSVDGVPPSVLNEARQVALQTRGDPQAVANFMRQQGFPEHAGAWCGDFVASVVHASGGTPPAGSAVAGNWGRYGTPRQGPPQRGDIAMIRGWDPRTGMGVSHVTIVESVNPDGTFTALGGNQGGGRLTRSRFPITSGIFRVPPADGGGTAVAGGAPAGGAAGSDGGDSDGIFSQLSPNAFDDTAAQGDQTAASP